MVVKSDLLEYVQEPLQGIGDRLIDLFPTQVVPHEVPTDYYSYETYLFDPPNVRIDRQLPQAGTRNDFQAVSAGFTLVSTSKSVEQLRNNLVIQVLRNYH